jgi:hypothetical protein
VVVVVDLVQSVVLQAFLQVLATLRLPQNPALQILVQAVAVADLALTMEMPVLQNKTMTVAQVARVS